MWLWHWSPDFFSYYDSAMTLRIGPLHGGGLVLGYRCPSRCRHCLYGAGPHRRDGEPADDEALDRILDLLAEGGPEARYHIGGGEPFLDVDRLAHAVRGLVERGLILEYVETNAFWAKDRDHAERVLTGLADEGLSSVLVSLSPFHAEFVPLSRTLAAIEAAERVLPGGAFVWIPGFLAEITEVDNGGLLDLDALLVKRGERYARGLADRYGLVSAGRAGRYLHEHGRRLPWREVVTGCDGLCRARLADTSHFHVDCEGLYVPGLCAGIALPFDELFAKTNEMNEANEIDLDRYPLLRALVEGGPAALVELARDKGFRPAKTYASACDLCTQARLSLSAAGCSQWSELGPKGFYEARSISGHGV